MPHFRNLNVNRRQSGRLIKQEPIIYDKQGWEVPDPFAPSTREQAARQTVSRASSATSSPPSSHPSHLGNVGPDLSINHPKSVSHRRDHDHGCHPYLFPREHSASSSASKEYSPDDSSLRYPLHRKTTSHSRRKAADHIPRPRNAFILFRSSFLEDFFKKDGDRRAVKLEQASSSEGDGKVHQNHISREAGKVWKSLSDEEKRPYHMLAEIEKCEHQAKFPNYIYSPNGKLARKAKSTKPTTLRRGSRIIVPSSTRMGQLGNPVERVPEARANIPALGNQSLTLSTNPLVHFASCTPEVEIPPLSSVSPSPSPALVPKFENLEWSMETHQDADFASGFVPTTDIPPLELSPADAKEEKTPKFDLSSQHPFYERVGEPFGLKPYIEHATVNAFFLSIADLHDESLVGPKDVVLHAPVPRRDAGWDSLHNIFTQDGGMYFDDVWDGCNGFLSEPPRLKTPYDELMDYFKFDEYANYNPVVY